MKAHDILAGLVSLVIGILLLVIFNGSLDSSNKFQDDRLNSKISKADRERVIANLKGEYK